MNEKDILNLAVARESEDHEFMESPNETKIVKAACAFLNSDGGRIVARLKKSDTKSQSQIEDKLRDSILPSSMITVTVEDTNEGRFLVIDVPDGASKPYLIDGTIWFRQGAETRRATPNDVSEIIRDRIRADDRWERRPALGVELDDLDVDEVLLAASEIQKSGRLEFESTKDPLSILQELSLMSSGQLTNAAVILFGKHPGRIFPQAGIRVTVYETSKKGKTLPFDTLIDEHLFKGLERIVDLLRSHVGVSSDFDAGSWKRNDKAVYPFWAVREGVLNAIVHRDLSTPSGGTSIGIYPDRIKIWNFGALPEGWTSADLTKDHPSLPRNPDITHVCFLRGFVEKLGRGTQLISEEFKEAGLEKPEWTTSPLGVELVFKNAEASRTSAQTALNERALTILKMLKIGEEFTVDDYVSLSPKKISDRTARTDLNRLISAGFIRRQGRGKNTFYIRTSREISREDYG